MAKKEAYLETAEKMYVSGFKSVADIAAQLNLSEKTLFNWKKEGNWEAKRLQRMQQETKLDEDIYVLTRLLIKDLKDQREAGGPTNLDLLDRIIKLVDKSKKAKDYEDTKNAGETANDNKPKVINPETIEFIEKEFFGLER